MCCYKVVLLISSNIESAPPIEIRLAWNSKFECCEKSCLIYVRVDDDNADDDREITRWYILINSSSYHFRLKLAFNRLSRYSVMLLRDAHLDTHYNHPQTHPKTHKNKKTFLHPYWPWHNFAIVPSIVSDTSWVFPTFFGNIARRETDKQTNKQRWLLILHCLRR